MPASRTVLITGAAGFAGSALVDHYLALGWDVAGITHVGSHAPARSSPRLTNFPLDLRNGVGVLRVVREVEPDVVCHLAARSSVSASWHDPIGTLTDNAVMQYNLLEAVVQGAPAARVLVVGTSDEYGNVSPEDNPLDESAPLQPVSPYALSKVTQDLMGLQYAHSGRANVVRVRPFLQVGPRRPSTFAAGSFARQIAEIERGLRPPVLTVGSIDLQRDFTDVRDVVRAYALATERGITGQVYNIASGVPHTLRELIGIMLEVSGVESEIHVEQDLLRGHEAPLIVGSSRAFTRLSGWQPEISFQQSAADTVAYWRDRVAGGTLREEDTV